MKSLLIVIGCCGGLLLSGCGKSEGPSVKVGLNVELTGDIPAVGASARNAAELYAAQVNAAGGVAVGKDKLPLRLIVGDNAAKAEQAAAVAQKPVAHSAFAEHVRHTRIVASQIGDAAGHSPASTHP